MLRADPQKDGSYTVTRVTFDNTMPNGILILRASFMMKLCVGRTDVFRYAWFATWNPRPRTFKPD